MMNLSFRDTLIRLPFFGMARRASHSVERQATDGEAKKSPPYARQNKRAARILDHGKQLNSRAGRSSQDR
jgi:hypothetical protein